MRGLGNPGDGPPAVEDHRSVAAAGEILVEDAEIEATNIMGNRLWLFTRPAEGAEMVWIHGVPEDLGAWR